MRFRTIFPALLAALAACGPLEELQDRTRGPTPHEDYAEALRAAGLLDSALGRDWLAAASHAIAGPLDASVPVEESGYFDPQRAEAIALRLTLQRGQRVEIRTTLAPDTTALLFIDVFRLSDDTTAAPLRVASADSAARSLELEPPRTGTYIVRVQPELLRGGRYTIRVRSGPSLAFPVHGAAERAIGSRFGAPRDGGAREHHGIDIFAPRGTPVIASAEAVVSRVRETPRGGRVVWLRDERRSQSLYYAHLDEQRVEQGQRVLPGDTIGTVGNTGNAVTTAPHLHFGIYRRGEGPVDPFPFVYRPPRTPAPLRVDTALFGTWARVRDGADLGVNGTPYRLPANTAVLVRGGSGSRYRVELPDGTTGAVVATALAPLGSTSAAASRSACALLDAPRADAAVIEEVPPGTPIGRLAEYGGYALVRANGRQAWSACG